MPNDCDCEDCDCRNYPDPPKRVLTFEDFRVKNVARMERWHDKATEEWSGGDWGNALAGEVGEACNVIKKLRRISTGVPGKRGRSREYYLAALAHELADIFAYLDLVAHHYGIDLPAAIVDKFNIVSAENDFPERL